MPPGTAPKPDDERIRRNAPQYEKVPIHWDGELRGPELPKDIGINWMPMTRMWWEVWRKSPNSMVMTDVDWMHMIETAMLYNEFVSPSIKYDGRQKKMVQVSKSPAELTNLAAEIRRRLASYGGTFDDRRKLRMEFKTPQTEAEKQAALEELSESDVDYLSMVAKKVQNKKK